MVLYMCCTNDKYELPLCVSDDSNEIDRKMGFCHGYTLSCISRIKSGEMTLENARYKFERVEVEDDPEIMKVGVCRFCGREFFYAPHGGSKPRTFCDEHQAEKYKNLTRYREKAEERRRAKKAKAMAYRAYP